MRSVMDGVVHTMEPIASRSTHQLQSGNACAYDWQYNVMKKKRKKGRKNRSQTLTSESSGQIGMEATPALQHPLPVASTQSAFSD